MRGSPFFWALNFVLSGLGILLLGTLLHEGIHILQGDGVESICLDFGRGTSMHVEGKSFSVNTEWWAYGVSSVFIAVCLGLLFVYTKRRIKDET